MRSLKKIIGSLGRRYGGRPFQIVRKACYDFASVCQQCYEVSYLARGRYAPNHRDSRFYKKYYLNNEGQASEKTGEPVDIRKGIICMCDGRRFHGGPTDRLRGILTTYREASKRGIPFYIYWRSPFALEDYYEPATFDWRIKGEEISYDPREAFPVIVEDETNLQSFMRNKAGLRLKFPQLHLYTNADNAIGSYKELFSELFRPTPRLKAEVEKNLSAIGGKYWAFTFRFLHLLGDFKEWERKELSEADANNFMEKVIREMFALMKDLPEDYRVLVTSDSRRFLDVVRDRDPRIYVVDGDVKNIDLLKGEYPEAWLKTFTDQQLLMRADKVFLMRTGRMYKSGFPRFAAEVGGAEFIDHQF